MTFADSRALFRSLETQWTAYDLLSRYVEPRKDWGCSRFTEYSSVRWVHPRVSIACVIQCRTVQHNGSTFISLSYFSHPPQCAQMVLFICDHVFNCVTFALTGDGCCVFIVDNQRYGQAANLPEQMEFIVCLGVRACWPHVPLVLEHHWMKQWYCLILAATLHSDLTLPFYLYLCKFFI